MLNIILPCVMLSILQLMVFLVPPSAGEKVSLGVTVLLSFTVFLLMVSDNMPQTSLYIALLGMNKYFAHNSYLDKVCIKCLYSEKLIFRLRYFAKAEIRIPSITKSTVSYMQNLAINSIKDGNSVYCYSYCFHPGTFHRIQLI